MHRTTTTAALLVTVAVSALCGCVTVQRPAAPAPLQDTARALATAPRPDGSTAPRVIQAPAEQALEMAGSSHRPKHSRPAAPRHRAEAPTAAPPPRAAASTHPRHRTEHHPRQARTAIPDLPSDSVPKAPDICALGRQYGGWQQGSPESQICDRTYGH